MDDLKSFNILELLQHRFRVEGCHAIRSIATILEIATRGFGNDWAQTVPYFQWRVHDYRYFRVRVAMKMATFVNGAFELFKSP